MKTFKDLEFKEHPCFPVFSEQAEMNFDNGYGISVVNGKGAYSGPGTYEVAILKNGALCHNTNITDDVLGWQSPDDVSEIMIAIQNL